MLQEKESGIMRQAIENNEDCGSAARMQAGRSRREDFE
jgi:hypothetical protein